MKPKEKLKGLVTPIDSLPKFINFEHFAAMIFLNTDFPEPLES